MNRTEHWNRVYSQKADTDLSWYQPEATLSCSIIQQLGLQKDAAIIDIGGGGPSAFPVELTQLGYTHLTVLDISAEGLQRCRQRLGNQADAVTWVEADITRFAPTEPYDVWHDRAVFHFLTEARDQLAYRTALYQGVKAGGYAMIAAFAPDGPASCSGLNVMRWEPQALAELLGDEFVLTALSRENHQTPWGKPQAFTYCLFRRIKHSQPLTST